MGSRFKLESNRKKFPLQKYRVRTCILNNSKKFYVTTASQETFFLCIYNIGYIQHPK